MTRQCGDCGAEHAGRIEADEGGRYEVWPGLLECEGPGLNSRGAGCSRRCCVECARPCGGLSREERAAIWADAKREIAATGNGLASLVRRAQNGCGAMLCRDCQVQTEDGPMCAGCAAALMLEAGR